MSLVKAYDDYKGKSFAALSVWLDIRNESGLKAIQNNCLNSTNVSDLKYSNNAATIQFGINAPPTDILISAARKMVAEHPDRDRLEGSLINFRITSRSAILAKPLFF